MKRCRGSSLLFFIAKEIWISVSQSYCNALLCGAKSETQFTALRCRTDCIASPNNTTTNGLMNR